MKEVLFNGRVVDLNGVFPELTGSVTESLIIDGKDTFRDFGLILLHDFTLSPPEPKYNWLDVPGSDRTMELTRSLTGDMVYSNRVQKFPFRTFYPDDFEQVKTALSNFLHGREYDYRLSWDPEYTYHGTFRIADYSDAYGVATIGVEVSADPYKLKEVRTLKVNAAGGVTVNLPSGRRRVRPTFDVSGEAEIEGKGAYAHFYRPGAYVVNDLWLEEGDNLVFVNTFFGKGTVKWGDLQDKTWERLSKRRYHEWMFDGSDFNVPMRWGELPAMKWRDFARIPFEQWRTPASATEEFNVYIRYEWSDL